MKFLCNLWRTGDLRPAPPPPEPRDGERGVALLLTLGILSLLLILAMSFAFSTRVERMAAAVNADLTRARLLAESGLDRTLAYLRYAFPYDMTGVVPATGTPPYFSPWDSRVLYPATSGALFEKGPDATDWADRYFSPSRNTSADAVGIETALATNLGFPFVPNGSPFANQSWHHIRADGNGDGDTIDNPEDPLVGRIVFLIVDESGKIDPNAVIGVGRDLNQNGNSTAEPFYDANGDGDWTTGEYYFDVDGNGVYTSTTMTEGTEIRLGGSMQEISAGNIIPGYSSGATSFVSHLPSPSTKKARWFSWRQMFETLSKLPPVSPATSVLTATLAKAGTRSVFPYSQDIEAWNESGPDKHRFDLFGTTTTWDATSFDILKSGGSGTTANFWQGSPPVPYSAVNTTATNCIAWLRTLTDAGGTSVSNQVIANLIDYSDSDSATTNNYGEPGWVTTPYVGLEKTPYLNEVFFRASVADDGDGTFTLNLEAWAELINMYEVDLPAFCTQLDVTLTVNGGAPVTASFELTQNATLAAPLNVTVPMNNYRVVNNGTTFAHDLGASGTAALTIASVNAFLTSTAGAVTKANLLDFARITEASPPASVAISTTCQAYVQAKDPRANDTDWSWSGAFDTGTASPDEGDKNAAADPNGSGKDAETSGDPANLSTAFISNKPMKSLWELGAIHRGEPWCTINLSAYNSTVGGASPSYKYSDGDANILDQVKLGGFVAGPGKFNANSAQAEAWKAVLTGIKLGGTYADPAPSALPLLSVADITAVTAAVLAANGTTGGSASAGRGSSAAALCTLASQTTDRKKEEIIGKIANLLTTRQNYFSIIVTAQAVKDFGTSVSSLPAAVRQAHTDWLKYYDGNGDFSTDDATDKWCAILAESKLLAIVYRDAFANKFKIERIEYLDE